MSKINAEKSTIPPGNLILIAISYQVIIIIGDSVLLGGFKLGYEVLCVFNVDAKILECRCDVDFMLYVKHECRVELVMRHFEFLCLDLFR